MARVELFVTSILSTPKLRAAHDRYHRYLGSLRVPYTSYDVASDEDAKLRWRRKNRGKNELPFVLVDDEWVGTVEELDEANEFGELRQLLRLDTGEALPSSVAEPTWTGEDPRVKQEAPKPSIDDFEALGLTKDEIAALQAEIESGSTFNGALNEPSAAAATATPQKHFSTREFTPSPVTKPLNFKRKVTYERPIKHAIAAEPDELDLDSLKLTEQEIRELEESFGLGSILSDVAKDKDQTGIHSIAGVGGAQLSGEINEVNKLKLSKEDVQELEAEVLEGPRVLKVQQEPERDAAALEPEVVADEDDEEPTIRAVPEPTEAEMLEAIASAKRAAEVKNKASQQAEASAATDMATPAATASADV